MKNLQRIVTAACIAALLSGPFVRKISAASSDPNVTFKVTIKTDGRTAIPNIQLKADGPKTATATSDSNGECTFTSMPKGTYALSCNSYGFTSGYVRKDISGSVTIEMTLQPVLQGGVYDAVTKQPVPDGHIFASWTARGACLTNTNKWGNYVVSPVPIGKWTVSADGPGHGQQSVEVIVSATTGGPSSPVNFYLKSMQ